ncbi:MAG: hypothetical protein JW931_05255 [Methanomicrobiaceae archaeon]|nr:hypothetical protein [Methanomicrobiaceae archaeon]
MAVNQSQVDHILTTASADDPEVKLQNLQDEVDLLKKSVKKLLIDLRERMNEMENPFIVSAGLPPLAELPEKKIEPINEPEEEKTESLSKAEDKTESKPDISEIEKNTASEENLLSDLQEKYEEIRTKARPVPTETLPSERPRLQKLHQLFEWVSRMVKKYGHDRLEIMTGTYYKMGYISRDACRQINDMARLMPESIGDFHEIGSEEFVSELYLLNRILIPEDSSLDREMIEVIMDNKEPGEKDSKKISTEDSGYEEDWIELLEKI